MTLKNKAFHDSFWSPDNSSLLHLWDPFVVVLSVSLTFPYVVTLSFRHKAVHKSSLLLPPFSLKRSNNTDPTLGGFNNFLTVNYHRQHVNTTWWPYCKVVNFVWSTRFFVVVLSGKSFTIYYKFTKFSLLYYKWKYFWWESFIMYDQIPFL